jgi:hypothetical protein
MPQLRPKTEGLSWCVFLGLVGRSRFGWQELAVLVTAFGEQGLAVFALPELELSAAIQADEREVLIRFAGPGLEVDDPRAAAAALRFGFEDILSGGQGAKEVFLVLAGNFDHQPAVMTAVIELPCRLLPSKPTSAWSH